MSARPRWLQSIFDHPGITLVMVVCTLVGVYYGYAWIDPSLAVGRRLVGGALIGAFFGWCITVPRMLL